MPDRRKWIVTLSGERPLADLKPELKAAGAKVGEAMDEIGVVSVECAEGAARKLRGIKGVSDVSPDHPIDIGPRGSADTW